MGKPGGNKKFWGISDFHDTDPIHEIGLMMQVLLINGAQNGAQGWEWASNPTLNPVIYDPATWTFQVQPASTIPRMYHSTANLLADGRVLVAGSNCHKQYTFIGDFPTELRVEAFQPAYLDAVYASIKPLIVEAPAAVNYNTTFGLQITVPSPLMGPVNLTLTSSPFTTHSYSQGQRQVKLPVTYPTALGNNVYSVSGTGPVSSTIAPPSWYMLHVLNQGIPSSGIWVQVVWLFLIPDSHLTSNWFRLPKRKTLLRRSTIKVQGTVKLHTLIMGGVYLLHHLGLSCIMKSIITFVGQRIVSCEDLIDHIYLYIYIYDHDSARALPGIIDWCTIFFRILISTLDHEVQG